MQEIDQLQRIFSLLGVPSDAVWPGVTSLPGFRDAGAAVTTASPAGAFNTAAGGGPAAALAAAVPDLDAEGLDLLGRMLMLAPSRRITAARALQHPWFQGVMEAAAE